MLNILNTCVLSVATNSFNSTHQHKKGIVIILKIEVYASKSLRNVPFSPNKKQAVLQSGSHIKTVKLSYTFSLLTLGVFTVTMLIMPANDASVATYFMVPNCLEWIR